MLKELDDEMWQEMVVAFQSHLDRRPHRSAQTSSPQRSREHAVAKRKIKAEARAESAEQSVYSLPSIKGEPGKKRPDKVRRYPCAQPGCDRIFSGKSGATRHFQSVRRCDPLLLTFADPI